MLFKPILLALLAGMTLSLPLDAPYSSWGLTSHQMQDFLAHMAKYGKSYDYYDEFEPRAKRFAEVDTAIREWNSNPDRTHNLGHNQFSDWYPEEYRALLKNKSGKALMSDNSKPAKTVRA